MSSTPESYAIIPLSDEERKYEEPSKSSYTAGSKLRRLAESSRIGTEPSLIEYHTQRYRSQLIDLLKTDALVPLAAMGVREYVLDRTTNGDKCSAMVSLDGQVYEDITFECCTETRKGNTTHCLRVCW